MRAKLTLVLALGFTMMFSEGCDLAQMMQGLQVNGSPLGPLAQAGMPNPLGQQPGPLDGSLSSGLPPFAPDTTSATPGVPGLNPAAPANVPTAPGNTGAPVDPNALTPPAVAGGTPQAIPVGAGPIDPASLPTLPAASTPDPLALAPTLPTPPGI